MIPMPQSLPEWGIVLGLAMVLSLVIIPVIIGLMLGVYKVYMIMNEEKNEAISNFRQLDLLLIVSENTFRDIFEIVFRKEKYLNWYCKHKNIKEEEFWDAFNSQYESTVLPDCLIKRYVKNHRLSIEEQLTHPDERIRKHAHPH